MYHSSTKVTNNHLRTIQFGSGCLRDLSREKRPKGDARNLLGSAGKTLRYGADLCGAVGGRLPNLASFGGFAMDASIKQFWNNSATQLWGSQGSLTKEYGSPTLLITCLSRLGMLEGNWHDPVGTFASGRTGFSCWHRSSLSQTLV